MFSGLNEKIYILFFLRPNQTNETTLGIVMQRSKEALKEGEQTKNYGQERSHPTLTRLKPEKPWLNRSC